MAAPRRIGILTGGGDVPGLNSVIKSVVYRATELGYEVLGIRRGWEGLTHQRRGSELDPEYVRVLDRINTRTIDRTGGTILHSSRTNPRKMKTAALPSWLDAKSVADKQTSDGVYDLTDHVLDTIEHLGLSNLVTIGGDDTLSFSSVLYERGLPLVGGEDRAQGRRDEHCPHAAPTAAIAAPPRREAPAARSAGRAGMRRAGRRSGARRA
jgi:ATP-dependent phosphofructokinase / diphosphate-dependent phosphofructokinase